MATLSPKLDRKDPNELLRPRGVKNDFGPKHPINHADNHEKLLQHIKTRLDGVKEVREQLWQRCADVDMQTHSFPKLDRDDRKRDAENKKGGAPKPVMHNLPLVASQIDEMVTYLLSVFAPNGVFFQAVAGADKQPLVQAFVKHINDGGQRVDYYGEFSKFFTNGLMYNLGAITTAWEKHRGIEFASSPAGEVKMQSGIVWEGNVLQNVDIYNFLFDCAVHPTKLASRGEWYATVEMKTQFRCRKMEEEGSLLAVDRFIDDNKGTNGTRYYKTKPAVRKENSTSVNTMDWSQLLTAGTAKETQAGIELVRWTGWLKPVEFGLGEEKDYRIYTVVLANGDYIANAIEENSSSGLLPIGVITPVINDLDNDQRTYAEQLLPFQHFSSFLMNSHQEATRKALYGVKFYDASVLPNLEKERTDMISGWVPSRSTAPGVDLNKAIRVLNDAPTTSENIQQIGQVDSLMQKILPTEMLKQVADLDRATQFQAAATVQGSSRRALRIARLIMSQGLSSIKTLMIHNVYLFQEAIEVIVEGQKVTVNPKDLRDQKIELEIAGGVKGLDRLLLMQHLYQILVLVMQSQAAMAEIDVVKLLNYYTTLVGDDTDLLFFRRTEAAPALPATAEPGQSPTVPQEGA